MVRNDGNLLHLTWIFVTIFHQIRQLLYSQDAGTVLSDGFVYSSDTSNYPAPDLCCCLPDFKPASNPVSTWALLTLRYFAIRLKQPIVKLSTGKTTVLRSLLETLVKNLC